MMLSLTSARIAGLGLLGVLMVELRGHGGIVGQFLATPQAHVDPLLKTSL